MPNGETIHAALTEQRVWEILNEIPDPEIPVISIVELGAVQGVSVKDEIVEVRLMPTYSGCPAIKTFTDDIIKTLLNHGAVQPIVKLVYAPAWTTDLMTDEAREKLRKYGIAPPQRGTADKGVLFEQGPKTVACPRCGNQKTKLVSQFGSTPCKAMYQCEACLEPFDYFKCI
jgi:ring-1,2-phenylacetyl-CoA epoxidase subunit PaaD